MNFYKDAFKAEIGMMQRYGESPMPATDDLKDKIMHGVMNIMGGVVMFSDSDGKKHINFGDNFSVSLDYKEPGDMQRAFDAISAGGSVTMPLQDTFWGARFGMCTDKFGVNWMFNHDYPKPE